MKESIYLIPKISTFCPRKETLFRRWWPECPPELMILAWFRHLGCHHNLCRFDRTTNLCPRNCLQHLQLWALMSEFRFQQQHLYFTQKTSISRLRKSTVGDPRARRRVKRGKHCISRDFVPFLASMSTMPCMVSELTSSDQLTVWGRVVVERQVFADQARRPFSAILAKNLKQRFFRASNTALTPSQFFEAKKWTLKQLNDRGKNSNPAQRAKVKPQLG